MHFFINFFLYYPEVIHPILHYFCKLSVERLKEVCLPHSLTVRP